MPMVNVGVVCVRMFQPLVPVRMRVGFAGGIVERVLVLMMFVVSVFVLVRQRLMDMLVCVSFCDVQPDSDSHEKTRG